MIPETIVNLNLPYTDKGFKRVRVFVPEHSEGETLPVIYMTDGQNLFEDTSVQLVAGIPERRFALSRKHREIQQ